MLSRIFISINESEDSMTIEINPATENRFFGRSQELRQIEKAFVQDGTRRITISGIGGQGKTYLAIEAGQYLSSSGIFKKVCFVDYATFFGMDAIGLAVRTLAKVFETDLENSAAASEALRNTPTLLILDNVEIIPPESLQELLAAAKQWSEIGACRVLLTSSADFEHPDYKDLIPLSGLAEEEALAYAQDLLKLPTLSQIEQDDLLSLFKLVAFHPFSIGILAKLLQQKTHHPAELRERLKTWLVQTPDNPLWAALMVYLERFTFEKTGFWYWLAKMFWRKTTKRLTLSTNIVRFLPALGVFHGGAFEIDITYITDFNKKKWLQLRNVLEIAGMIQIEFMPKFKIAYIKFHPSLAPMLWTRLSSEDQTRVLFLYQYRYAQLASYMFYEEGESMEQVHNLVRRDLPNLLRAAYGALDADRNGAKIFANQLDLFLNLFKLKRESVALTQRVKNAEEEAS